MVRASSYQQKAKEAVLAEVKANGCINGAVETMDSDEVYINTMAGANISKSSALKSSADVKATADEDTDNKDLPSETSLKKQHGSKRKISSDTSPAIEDSKSSQVISGRRRTQVSTQSLQPQSKRTKFSAQSLAPLELSAPALKGGVVLTVGMGDIGQLGLGPDVEEKTRVALVPGLPDNIVAVAAGGLHSVCFDDQGKVYTWGCNDEGALGRNTLTEEDNFSAGLVEGIEGSAVQVTAGDCHTAVLTTAGVVYAWGCFRDNNGPLGFLERGTLQRTPRVLPVCGEAVTKLASGNNHLVMLGRSGRLYTCGCGESGQLGRLAEVFATRDSRNRNGFDVLLVPAVVKVYQGRRLVLFDGVWAGGDNTFARDSVTGYIYSCGLNNYNQMGVPDTNTKFQPVLLKNIKDKKWQQFTCGQHHGLCLDTEGRVYSMGRHDYGRLGLGEDVKKDAVTPTLVPGLQDPVKDVSAAGSVSVVVAENGVCYGFGMGTSNQLSQGSDDDCWSPTVLTGKQLTERRVVTASVGGQHSVLLAAPK